MVVEESCDNSDVVSGVTGLGLLIHLKWQLRSCPSMVGGVTVTHLNSEFKGHSPRALVVEEPCDRNSGPATIMTGQIVVRYLRLTGVSPLFHLKQ